MRIFITIAAILYGAFCMASPIDANKAKVNAETFMKKSSSGIAQARQQGETDRLSLVYESSANNEVGYPLYYVFNRGNHNGYVIAAGDDCINEVLGFSDTGDFDVNDIPENMQWWLSEYEREMEYAIQHGITLKAAETRAGGYANINPLLTCTWGQGNPFNALCPTGKDGKKCYTGCVATALAQIMYYHKWPEKGVGMHEYICPVDYDESNRTTLSADFGNTYYRWNSMMDSYKNGGSSAANDAVATLMYHIGVSLDMVYGTSGSSPTRNKEADALKSFFRYSSDVKSIRGVKDEDDLLILYDELTNKRPVYVCGSGSNGNGAHAFVCDGYKTGNYFHFNWGWGGRYDGYFLLTSMTPTQGHDYSYNHWIVYNIKPYYGDFPTGAASLHVNTPGELQNIVEHGNATYAKSIKVSGNINGTDILAIRKLAGRDEHGNQTSGILEELDLSDANIVDGGDCFFKIDDETYYKSQYGTVANKFPDQACMKTNIKKIILPSSITSIGRYSFVFCYNLEDVEFGENLEKVEFSAFNYTSLTTLILPEKVKQIGAYAFCNMAYLKSVSLGKNISKIEYRAFEKDYNISEIKSYIMKPFAISEDVFSDACYKNATLYVPYGTSGLYKQKTGWKNFSKIKEMESSAISTVKKSNIEMIMESDGTLRVNGITNDKVVVYDMTGAILFNDILREDKSITVSRRTFLIIKIRDRYYKMYSK